MKVAITTIVNRVALAVVAGLVSTATASAADLGGNCCADLEERIAELEATAVRKGNRKVSLTVSGQVNETLMFWDDGVESNAYVATNEVSRSRFRFLGSAKIDASWSAGYLLEIGVRGNRQNQLNQDNSSTGKGFDVRHSAWWLQNKDLGRITIGQTSEASDGITEINLGNVGHFAGVQVWDSIGGFFLRGANGAKSTTNIVTLGLDNVPGEGARFNVVRYDTPTLFGFVASTSFGEDNVWDVALRYAGEANGFKLAAGIAYTNWNDATTNPRNCARLSGKGVSCDEVGMSASLMHMPTGLYVTGLYGQRHDDNRAQMTALAGTANGTKSTDQVYMVQAGLERKFNALGATTFYGEYWEGDFGAAISGGSASAGTFASTKTLGLAGFGGIIGTSDISMWGLGVNQNIAAAAMDIYVGYRNYGFDVKDIAGNRANLNDLQVVTAGAIIKF